MLLFFYEKGEIGLDTSFPTNSILLKGLIFLKKYFYVYFIDLPGFNPNIKPLKDISIKNYASYVSGYIKKHKLKNYWLGGISYGFLIAHEARANFRDKSCQGIMAIEPFIDYSTLEIPYIEKKIFSLFTNFVLFFHIEKIIWRSNYFKKLLISSKNTGKRIEIMLNTIDPRTFFVNSRIILSQKRSISFLDLPYILIRNKRDKTLHEDVISNLFINKVKNLCVIDTSSEHYPKNIDEKYFKSHISHKNILKIINFMK